MVIIAGKSKFNIYDFGGEKLPMKMYNTEKENDFLQENNADHLYFQTFGYNNLLQGIIDTY